MYFTINKIGEKMDCCENTKQNTKKESKEESMKGGKNMAEINKKTMLWIVIGILFLSVIFLTYKASSIGKVSATGNAIDTTSWTANEKMNYEMHGTIPARLQGKVAASSVSSGTGMVGGC